MKLIFKDETALADEAARRFYELALSRDRTNVSLTGGQTPRAIYERFAAEKGIPWDRVHLWFGDERAVPPDDPESNYRMVKEALLDRAAVPPDNVHRMPAELPDLEAAAAAYGNELPDAFDLVHLGMGPDGHICSLFPGHPLLDETRRKVAAIHDSPKPPPRRVTLTMPVLQSAKAIWFLVTGEAKAEAVHDVLQNPRSTRPAARLMRSKTPITWFLDRAAAKFLGEMK